jgi:hypothetical protein
VTASSFLLLLACSEPAREPAGANPRETDRIEPALPAAEAPSAPSCDDRAADAEAALAAVVAGHSGCEFDVDCVVAAARSECFAACDRALTPRGIEPLRDAAARIDCSGWRAADCGPRITECGREIAFCDAGTCAVRDGAAPLRDVSVPPENERASTPPRPPPSDAEQERARRLFLAIVRDEPALAQDFFFPREAFARVKAIAGADAYWQRLFARYFADIHALHEALPDLDRAEFDRLEIVRRGGWVVAGEEANALPYWAARHNLLHYRVGDEARTLEVRVVITWGQRWYITHLSEFH